MKVLPIAMLVISTVACAAPADEEATSAGTASIVGGKKSAIHPSVGFLVQPSASKPHCTATLIAPNVVLSAAHCWSGPLRLDFGVGPTVEGAELHAPKPVDSEGPMAKIHPSWDGFDHDLAYMILAEPITTVVPAEIGTHEHRFDCSFDVVGYGFEVPGSTSTSEGSPQNRKTASMSLSGTLANTTLLTVHGLNGTPCFGDSGGGLLATGDHDVLTAVVSRGDACSVGANVYFQPLSTEGAFVEEALSAGRAAAAADSAR